MSAVLSECGSYRYLLTRPATWDVPERSAALFVMLNPSTADAEIDDPTIRRCRGFARDWSCNGLSVVNLYAFRSVSPKALWQHHDPVGPEANFWLAEAARKHGDVVCAWGANAKPERVREVVAIFQRIRVRMFCLGITKAGAPRHPLYVKADQPLISWEPTV